VFRLDELHPRRRLPALRFARIFPTVLNKLSLSHGSHRHQFSGRLLTELLSRPDSAFGGAPGQGGPDRWIKGLDVFLQGCYLSYPLLAFALL
jgi:hypothetical protein